MTPDGGGDPGPGPGPTRDATPGEGRRSVGGVPAVAVLWGLFGQAVYLLALYSLPPRAALGAASPLLLAASGAVGGQMAGHVAAEHGASPTRSAAAAAGVGGVGLATVTWWLLVTPGAPAGAFWSLAYALATTPSVPASLVPPGLGGAAFAVGVATARLPLRWNGSLVGRG